jgi:hypothetical protein
VELSETQKERIISAIERFVEAFEAGVANQSKIVEQTIKTMKMAQDLADFEKM